MLALTRYSKIDPDPAFHPSAGALEYFIGILRTVEDVVGAEKEFRRRIAAREYSLRQVEVPDDGAVFRVQCRWGIPPDVAAEKRPLQGTLIVIVEPQFHDLP